MDLQTPIFDWPLHFYLTRAGKGLYMNENMAAYRSHDNGVWSGTDHVKNSLRYYHFYNCILKPILASTMNTWCLGFAFTHVRC